MHKIAIVGSCISVKIAEHLKKNIANSRIIQRVHHCRSDMLVQNIQKSVDEIPSKQDLQGFVDRRGNPKELKRNYIWTNFNSRENHEKFVSSLQKSTILLLDNLYDIRSEAFCGDKELGDDVIVKLKASGLYRGMSQGLMPINNSIKNYREFTDWVLTINPDIKIFLISTPPSGFHLASSPRMAERCQGFVVNGSNDRIFVFPAMPLLSELHVEGAVYFQDVVDASFAEVIQKTVFEDGDFLSILDDKMSALVDREYNFQNRIESVDGLNDMGQEIKDHPYIGLEKKKYWRTAVAEKNPLAISDLYVKKFDISPTSKVATFGSCFAQHIGRHLRTKGVNCLDYEPAPASLSRSLHQDFGFSMYSARYGNIYTMRQMLQLLQRVNGGFSPTEEVWENGGSYVDPFRPTIIPKGYPSKDDVIREKHHHLGKVLQLFKDLDLFVFTFGLTEAWVDFRDAAVFPVCPGVSGGTYDASKFTFRNFSYGETYNDFIEFREQLHKINPTAKFLLTVSPVPLTATASNDHVLVATTKSKSILRSVCATLYDEFDDVDYFPSYEIVSSFPYKAIFYEPNMRNVASEGVEYVMSHFFKGHSNLLETGQAVEHQYTEESEEKCDDMLLYGL